MLEATASSLCSVQHNFSSSSKSISFWHSSIVFEAKTIRNFGSPGGFLGLRLLRRENTLGLCGIAMEPDLRHIHNFYTTWTKSKSLSVTCVGLFNTRCNWWRFFSGKGLLALDFYRFFVTHSQWRHFFPDRSLSVQDFFPIDFPIFTKGHHTLYPDICMDAIENNDRKTDFHTICSKFSTILQIFPPMQK